MQLNYSGFVFIMSGCCLYFYVNSHRSKYGFPPDEKCPTDKVWKQIDTRIKASMTKCYF